MDEQAVMSTPLSNNREWRGNSMLTTLTLTLQKIDEDFKRIAAQYSRSQSMENQPLQQLETTIPTDTSQLESISFSSEAVEDDTMLVLVQPRPILRSAMTIVSCSTIHPRDTLGDDASAIRLMLKEVLSQDPDESTKSPDHISISTISFNDWMEILADDTDSISDDGILPTPVDFDMDGRFDRLIDDAIMFPMLDQYNFDDTESDNNEDVQHAQLKTDEVDNDMAGAANLASTNTTTDEKIETSDGSENAKLQKRHPEQWMDRFSELAKYYRRFGHCFVESKEINCKGLISWVKRQRSQYKLKASGKHSTLTDDRQSQLEELGFVWDSHEAAWNYRFDQLVAFRAAHGHTNVPLVYPANPQLGIWIKGQRRQYWEDVNSNIDVRADRYRRLKDIGFRFILRWSRNKK